MHLRIKENYYETGDPLEENKKSACGDDIYADKASVALLQ
jgi:hypothetical protein